MYTKIRKNANKKIAALIADATYITYNGKVSTMDDSFDSLEPVQIEASEVFEFMKKNYADLNVRLYDTHLEIIDGDYYFCDRIKVHFTPKPVEQIKVEQVEIINKPKMTLKAVQAYLAAGFTSPLNHGAKSATQPVYAELAKQIKEIKVIWSESSVFNRELRVSGDDINATVTHDEYARLVWLTLGDYKRRKMCGYFKTKLELTIGTGEKVVFRHDICPKEANLYNEWSAWVDYCLKEAS